MRRRKRFIIKVVALGLAVAAMGAPSAQARFDEGIGVPKQSEPTLVVSPDDRAFDRTSPTTSRPSPVAGDDDDVELVTLGVTGIILALGAGVAFIGVHEARKHKLARA